METPTCNESIHWAGPTLVGWWRGSRSCPFSKSVVSQMPLNKASGEPTINVSAAMFIAGSPDDFKHFEKEAGPTTNPRLGKPHAMNQFIGLAQPRSDGGVDIVLVPSRNRWCPKCL